MGLEDCFDSRQHNYNIIMGIIRKIVVIVAMIVAVTAISNGLALTPPLVFAQGSCLSDGGSVMKQADLLLSTGLASKGYKYMLIGPGWQVKMLILRVSETNQEGSKRIPTSSHQECKISLPNFTAKAF